jgi:hypothetical protein
MSGGHKYFPLSRIYPADRTIGALPVRSHLRPKGGKTALAEIWERDDEEGRWLVVEAIGLEQAESVCCSGDA